MACSSDDQAPASDQPELDAKASRLLKSAQRASEAAKRAYAIGVESTQTRVKQVSEVVLQNAHRAADSSKVFLSKVASKAGHYVDKAQQKASTYKGNVSRAIQIQPGDGEGESLGFPLWIMVWCSTLCGRKRASGVSDREMAPASEEEGFSSELQEEFSSEFLASTADEYAAALDEAADKFEEAVADMEKKNAADNAEP